MSDPLMAARGRLAGLTSKSPDNHQAIADAQRDLEAARAQRAIQKALDHPITTEQCQQLATMLIGGEQ